MVGDVDPELMRVLQRIAGSRGGNPAQLPAHQLTGGNLPGVGAASVGVFALGNEQTIGGGTIVLSSPFAWATWTIEESRDSVGNVQQVARTGPFCIDAVYVSSAATVHATIARLWTPAVDPIVDPRTGVVTSQTPNPALSVAPALRAVYLPGVLPAQLRRASLSLYLATTAAPPMPSDGPSAPIGVSVIAYPVDIYRRAWVRTPNPLPATLDATVVLPDAGAMAAWPAVSSATRDGAADYAERGLTVGAWGVVRVNNTSLGPQALSLAWEAF